MKKALLIGMCCLMAIIAPMQGQILGLGAATEWTQILNHYELVQQASQLINIYAQAIRTYRLAEAQAKHLFSASTYKGHGWKTWLQAMSRDTYGHNGGFIGNINGQLGGLNGSLRNLPDLSNVLGQLHGDTVDRITWQYSQAELEAGVAGYALDTAGDIHANDQSQNLAALDGIVFADGDEVNTAVQQAQKTSMAVAIVAHQNEDLKRLLTVITAQQAVELKAKRDMLEQEATNHRAWLQRAWNNEAESYLGNPSVRIGQFTY
jgi:hypothetical protein